MTEAADDDGIKLPIEAEVSAEEDGDDVSAEAGAHALIVFKEFREFADEQMSHIASLDAIGKDGGSTYAVPLIVKQTRDLALAAVFRAIGRMAETFDPPPETPPFSIDASRIGKDG